MHRRSRVGCRRDWVVVVKRLQRLEAPAAMAAALALVAAASAAAPHSSGGSSSISSISSSSRRPPPASSQSTPIPPHSRRCCRPPSTPGRRPLRPQDGGGLRGQVVRHQRGAGGGPRLPGHAEGARGRGHPIKRAWGAGACLKGVQSCRRASLSRHQNCTQATTQVAASPSHTDLALAFVAAVSPAWQDMLSDANPMVVANAIAALSEIQELGGQVGGRAGGRRSRRRCHAIG